MAFLRKIVCVLQDDVRQVAVPLAIQSKVPTDPMTQALGLSAINLKKLESRELLTEKQLSPPGVKIRALMNCSPQKIYNLLTDYRRLPETIFGLESAEVLEQERGQACVRFTMKLPFPVGRIVWTNNIVYSESNEMYRIAWTLVSGDLRANSGQLVMKKHDDNPNKTFADYLLNIETKFRLPKSAERLALSWLLPKVVDKLRDVVESSP